MNEEKGQALIIAMIALALGALVVVPFLNHAGTNLIGSRTQRDMINIQSAGDAGIEDAIWKLAYGGWASSFTHSGDQVNYQLADAVNGYNSAVTITANVTSQNTTAGTISDAVLDTLQFDTSTANTPSSIMVSANICAVVYNGPSNRGWVKTMSIDSGGNIGNSTIDSLNFDTTACYEPSIVNVTSGIFAVAYRGTSNRGYLRTFSIDSSGNIGSSYISTLTFDSSAGYEPEIINISGTTFAIAYRQSTNRGYVKTVSISASGIISGTILGTLNYDTTSYIPKIIQVSGSVYAIAYRGASNDIYVRTVSIAANGNIGTSIDFLDIDTGTCYEPSIVHVSGTTYAVAYRGTTNRGYLRTVSIDSAGNIAAAYVDTYTFDTTGAYEPSLLQTSSGVFGIAYRDTANRGKLVTVAIAADGTITQSLIDSLIFDSAAGYTPVILNVTGNIFAIAYRGSVNHGFICTIGISTTTTSTTALWQIVSTVGSTTIKAYVNTVNTTATVVSWQFQ
jgi:hypothetical protein